MFKKLILFGIYMFVFFVPLFPGKFKIAIIPVSADFLIIAYLAAVILIACLFRDERRRIVLSIKKLFSTKLFIAAIIFSVVCLLSFIPAVSKSAVIAELFRFWTYLFLFFVVVSYVDDERDVIKIMVLLMVSVFVSGTIGLYQFFTGAKKFADNSMGDEGRVYSTFVNPNYWGAFINLMIFPVLMLAVKKVKHYGLYYAFSALLLINLVMTYTRGSWIGFVVGLVIFIAAYSWKLIIPVIIASPIGLLAPSVRERIFSIFNSKSWTIVERIRLWKTGLLMFRDHPILGVGNGNYLLRYNEYIKKHPELDIGKEKFSVHNSYIKVLCETGILGFIPYLLVHVFYIGELLSIYKNPKNSITRFLAIAYICSIASYLVQNISNNMFFIPQVNAFYWIIGGLIIAYNNAGFKNQMKAQEG